MAVVLRVWQQGGAFMSEKLSTTEGLSLGVVLTLVDVLYDVAQESGIYPSQLTEKERKLWAKVMRFE